MAALALAAYRMAPETEPAPIAVTARAIALDPNDPAHDRVGALRYLGGLELASRDRRFGGISGMRLLADGRLQAVTEEGSWITLTLAENGDKLVGVGPVTIAAMADLTGRRLKSRFESLASGLELDTDGSRVVTFQRNPRVWRFDPDEGRPRARAFPDPDWLQHLPPAGGVSAIARVGALWLFLAEDAGPNGWNGILQGGGALSTTYGRIAYKPPEGFQPTDAAALDDTHVLVLSRRISPTMGVAASLALVPVDAAHLALGKPRQIAMLGWPLSIDNMEAVAVRHSGDRTFVYIASDDNFSPLQRTLLLKFELLPR